MRQELKALMENEKAEMKIGSLYLKIHLESKFIQQTPT